MKKRLCLIFAGLIFFFNPCFNMFDILPDFIGAALIMAGISPISLFDGNFESARKSAKYLIWISCVKLLLCMWCMGGHKDYLLPFSFAIAVLETIFMLSMFRSLYLGVEYTFLRSGSDFVKSVHSDEAFTMSFVFTIGGRFLDFAPEICEIYSQNAELDLSHKASFKMSVAQLKNYISAVCLVFGLVLGIIFVVVTARTWISLLRDKKYGAFLDEKYDDFIKNDRDVYVSKRISLAYIFFSVSVIFFYDFYIDSVNIIPSIIGVICLAVCGKIFCSLEKLKSVAPVFIPTAVFTVISGMFMQNVHKGVGYISMSDYSSEKEFMLLSKSTAMTVGIAVCIFSAFLTAFLFNVVISKMKKTFEREKRSGVMTEILIMRVLSVISAVLLCGQRVFTCVYAKYSTVPYVTDYIKNKAFITSGKVYEQMISNPDVVKYEHFVSLSTVTGVMFLFSLLAMIALCASMSRKTEGDGQNTD